MKNITSCIDFDLEAIEAYYFFKLFYSVFLWSNDSELTFEKTEDVGKSWKLHLFIEILSEKQWTRSYKEVVWCFIFRAVIGR